VHQFLPSAELRRRRTAASSQINLLDALRRLTSADVSERDVARCDRHLTASKISDEFGGRTAAATQAAHVNNVKPNPEVTRLDGSQGRSPRELQHVAPRGQSA